MNQGYPVFTADAECQDCFKCVRRCPVKAIKVEDGHASVMPELCIACGGCVEVCPVHAKKIRDDMTRARQLILGPDPVYVSLAPSWVSEFKGLPAKNMIASLKKLGFAGVGETAIGAQAVSDALALELKDFKSGLKISSACPVVDDFICKYMPEFAPCITKVLSPALTHAKLLKKEFGENAKVVFIGPCIAKKNESDRHGDLISLAMLFSRLRQWFKNMQIDPWRVETTDADVFVPQAAREGTLYPIEGGMNDTIKLHPGCGHVKYVAVTGLDSLRLTLEGLHPRDVREPVFLETLACQGGCVHGPGTEHGAPGLLERLRILRMADVPETVSDREPEVTLGLDYKEAPATGNDVSLHEIRQALLRVGKKNKEDELNCGGCGYNTCLNFAKALIAGKAEPNMCVSYMRKLAQKKSNAILRCIPAAVVIVDQSLTLIESNHRFAELCGESALDVWNVLPGMAGAALDTFINFSDLFREVLTTKNELSRDTIHVNGRLISLYIFNIDPGQVVGAMMFDVTRTEFRREEIAAQAREVIRKNLATVQDIACKLGEHMADTEILLRSIAENYADSPVDDEFQKKYK